MASEIPELLQASPDHLNALLNDLLHTPEVDRTPVDYLIVCGQGPVQTKYEKESAKEVDWDSIDDVEANSWMKFIALAAGEVYAHGLTKKIVLSGGKTGGDDCPSEAELMYEIITKHYNIPDEDIIIEDKAGNSLQNYAFTLNGLGEAANSSLFAVLGADYHVERLHLLSTLFQLPITEVYSAEHTLMHFWKNTLTEGSQKFLLSRVDHSEAERLGLYDQDLMRNIPLGREAKSARIRTQEERRYSAGLIEVPAYWLGYVGLLEDEGRIMAVLKSFDKEHLYSMGVDVTSPIEDIKKALLHFTKPLSNGGGRYVPYEEIAKTGVLPDELMAKIHLKIPQGLPVLNSVYY